MKILLALLLISFSVSAATVERIVAVVNQDVITSYDLDQATAILASEIRKSTNPEEKAMSVKRRVLEELIKQKLLDQEMAKSEIDVNEGELQRAILGVLQKNQISIEALRSELASKGISFEAYKDQLKKQLQQAKFIQQNLASQVQVTNQDVQNYRRQNLGTDFNAKVKVAWIFLPLSAKADADDRSQLVRKGRKISEKSREGHFETLKLEYGNKGKDPSTGEWEKWLSELPTTVASVVRQMPIEGVSDPIVTPEGVYILKLREKMGSEMATAQNISDDTIWQKLYNQRLEQEIDNYVLRLRRKAFVEIRE